MRKKLLNKKTGVHNRRTDDRAKARARRNKLTPAQIEGKHLATPAERVRAALPQSRLTNDGSILRDNPYASAQKHKTAVYAGGAIHTHLPKGKGHMISRPDIEV